MWTMQKLLTFSLCLYFEWLYDDVFQVKSGRVGQTASFCPTAPARSLPAVLLMLEGDAQRLAFLPVSSVTCLGLGSINVWVQRAFPFVK